MNAEKQARHDAREYARAQMYYGEGAGTRRKLISATVDSKAHKDPEYARAFHTELGRQDMSEHASKAQSERRRKDRGEAVSKNVKAALTGNSKSMNTGVLVASAVLYVAHQTGYDRKVYDKTRAYYKNLRDRYRAKRHLTVVHNITDVR